MPYSPAVQRTLHMMAGIPTDDDQYDPRDTDSGAHESTQSTYNDPDAGGTISTPLPPPQPEQQPNYQITNGGPPTPQGFEPWQTERTPAPAIEIADGRVEPPTSTGDYQPMRTIPNPNRPADPGQWLAEDSQSTPPTYDSRVADSGPHEAEKPTKSVAWQAATAPYRAMTAVGRGIERSVDEMDDPGLTGAAGTWIANQIRPLIGKGPVENDRQFLEAPSWLPSPIRDALTKGAQAGFEIVSGSAASNIAEELWSELVGYDIPIAGFEINPGSFLIPNKWAMGGMQAEGNKMAQTATQRILGQAAVDYGTGAAGAMERAPGRAYNAVKDAAAPLVQAGREAVGNAVAAVGRGLRAAGRAVPEGEMQLGSGFVPDPATIGRGGAPMEPWNRSGNDLYREGIRESAVTRERAARPIRPGTYYHVVPEGYRPGDPLLAADELAARGYPDVPNKWSAENGGDAAIWPDRDKVALAESYAEAYAFNQDYLKGRGRILEVAVPPDADALGVRIARNEEGVPSADRMIPAEWVRPAPEHTGAPYQQDVTPKPIEVQRPSPSALSAQDRLAGLQRSLDRQPPGSTMRAVYEQAIADVQREIQQTTRRGEPPAGSGFTPTMSDARNAAQGGVFGAASSEVDPDSENLTPAERLARIGAGAALGVAAGRHARPHGAAAAAERRLGSGLVPGPGERPRAQWVSDARYQGGGFTRSPIKEAERQAFLKDHAARRITGEREAIEQQLTRFPDDPELRSRFESKLAEEDHAQQTAQAAQEYAQMVRSGNMELGSGFVPDSGAPRETPERPHVYSPTPPEGVNRRYHGTASEFDAADPGKFDENGLYGPGYYTTSDPRVAGGYAEPRGPVFSDAAASNLERLRGMRERVANGESRINDLPLNKIDERITYLEGLQNQPGPNIRPVDVPSNLNMIDADAPLTQDTLDRVNAVIAQVKQKHVYAGEELEEAMGELAADMARRGPDARQPLSNDAMLQHLMAAAERAGAYTNLGYGKKGISTAILERAGFDGIAHQGGRRVPMMDSAGQPIEHDVSVIFPGKVDKVTNAFSGTKGGLFVPAGAAAGTETDEDGNPVGYDPIRGGAGVFLGTVGNSRAGRSLATKLAIDAQAVARAAAAGPGKRAAALVAETPKEAASTVPLRVRASSALTDRQAAAKWAEDELARLTGNAPMPRGASERATTMNRLNAAGVADARVEQVLTPIIKEADDAGLLDELVAHAADAPAVERLTRAADGASSAVAERHAQALDATKARNAERLTAVEERGQVKVDAAQARVDAHAADTATQQAVLDDIEQRFAPRIENRRANAEAMRARPDADPVAVQRADQMHQEAIAARDAEIARAQTGHANRATGLQQAVKDAEAAKQAAVDAEKARQDIVIARMEERATQATDAAEQAAIRRAQAGGGDASAIATVTRHEGQQQRLAANGKADEFRALADRVDAHRESVRQQLVDSGVIEDTPEAFDRWMAQHAKDRNPLAGLRAATIKAGEQAHRNDVARAFGEAVQMANEAQGLEGAASTVTMGGRKVVDEGAGKIMFKVNGKDVTVSVDRDIASAFESATKGGTSAQSVMDAYKAAVQWVNSTITSSRIAFLPTNLQRDFQDYFARTTALEKGRADRVIGTWLQEAAKAAGDIVMANKTMRTPASAVAGAAYGGSLGDENTTPGERVRNAAVGAGAGVLFLGANKARITGKAAEYAARGGDAGRVATHGIANERWYREVVGSGGAPIRSVADVLKYGRDWLMDIANLEGVRAINDRTEVISRTAAMRLADARGEGNVQAVMRGRDASYDPAVAGTMIRALNGYVPFLNATVQSAAQMGRYFNNGATRPEKVKRGAVALGTMVAATAPFVLAAEAWNRSDPERAAAYDDVSQSVKNSGLVVMMPWAGSDSRGSRPNYWVIPSGMNGPFIVAMREAARKLPGLPDAAPMVGTQEDDSEATRWGGVLEAALQQFSPLKGDSPAQIVASLVPPGLKQGTELYTNKNLYSGSPIQSARNDESATAVAQGAAGIVNRVGRAAGSDLLQNFKPSQADYLIRQAPAYGDLITGASEQAVPSARRQSEDRPVQNAPFVGGMASRIIKDQGGANLQRAQGEAMADDVRAALEEANLSPGDVSLRVPSSVNGKTLTRDEQLEAQNAFNDALSEELMRAQSTPLWANDPAKAFKAAVSRAQSRAGKLAKAS